MIFRCLCSKPPIQFPTPASRMPVATAQKPLDAPHCGSLPPGPNPSPSPGLGPSLSPPSLLGERVCSHQGWRAAERSAASHITWWLWGESAQILRNRRVLAAGSQAGKIKCQSPLTCWRQFPCCLQACIMLDRLNPKESKWWRNSGSGKRFSWNSTHLCEYNPLQPWINLPQLPAEHFPL